MREHFFERKAMAYFLDKSREDTQIRDKVKLCGDRAITSSRNLFLGDQMYLYSMDVTLEIRLSRKIHVLYHSALDILTFPWSEIMESS